MKEFCQDDSSLVSKRSCSPSPCLLWRRAVWSVAPASLVQIDHQQQPATKKFNITRWCLTALSCVFNSAPDKDHPLVSACAQSLGRVVGPGLCGRPPEPVECEKSRCLPAKFRAWLNWLWASCWFEKKKSLYLFRFLQIAMISFLNARRLGWPIWTCSISEQTEVRKYSWMAAWCSSGILKMLRDTKCKLNLKKLQEVKLFVLRMWAYPDRSMCCSRVR